MKMADKPADEEHPFGHGRMEYIAALIVSFLVIEVGFTFFKSSIGKLRTPETMNFDLVHCHTPMGGALARLAAHNTHTGPVIYTAHGFHFFKGAPLINWMIYYPVECYLSRYTDVLICINVEDYKRCEKAFLCQKCSSDPWSRTGY